MFCRSCLLRYRFPNHFFLPDVPVSSPAATPPRSPTSIPFKLQFLDSDFGGLLPQHYKEVWEHQQDIRAGIVLSENKTSATPTVFDQLAARMNLSTAAMLNNTDTRPTTLLQHLFPHSVTRPGTWRIPRGMNEWNKKEDAGRFVPVEKCHFIVDFKLPKDETKETVYEEHEVHLTKSETIGGRCVAGWKWRVEVERPFLDANASKNKVARALWIPGYSDKHNVKRPYQLLERYPIPCK
jgi:hypothetical protein